MAKKLKIKLPKRIGGVKVPKQVRKGPIAGFLNSGAGQMLLGEALLFAAGAFAAKRTDSDSVIGNFLHNPIDETRTAGGRAASTARRAASRNSARLHYAFAEAARAFQAAMSEDRSDDLDVVSARPEEGKKKSSRENRPDASSTPH
jgi:hypothetical protein